LHFSLITSFEELESPADSRFARRAIVEIKHRTQRSVIGWMTKNLLSQPSQCFDTIHRTGPRGGYGLLLYVIHKKSLYLSSGDIIRLMMLTSFLLSDKGPSGSPSSAICIFGRSHVYVNIPKLNKIFLILILITLSLKTLELAFPLHTKSMLKTILFNTWLRFTFHNEILKVGIWILFGNFSRTDEQSLDLDNNAMRTTRSLSEDREIRGDEPRSLSITVSAVASFEIELSHK
jgi:hypothetical protein